MRNSQIHDVGTPSGRSSIGIKNSTINHTVQFYRGVKSIEERNRQIFCHNDRHKIPSAHQILVNKRRHSVFFSSGPYFSLAGAQVDKRRKNNIEYEFGARPIPLQILSSKKTYPSMQML
jgi:hypothetical protein